MSLTPVYVVLVNYNGHRDTVECLESLIRSDYAALRIMVMDNGSTDDSLGAIVEWAAGSSPAPEPGTPVLAHLSTPPIKKPIRVMRCTRAELENGASLPWNEGGIALVANGGNLGFAGGNNVALRYLASTDPGAYALLLNNDTVIAPRAVSAMVRAAGGTDVGAVGATLLQYHAPSSVETLGGATVMWSGFIQLIGAGQSRTAARRPPSMDFISGCCMLITPAALSRVGVIDERFFLYCEDADWGLRATAVGLSLVYCADAEVWHKGGATSVPRSEFHDYHTTKSVLHFVRKHRPMAVPAAVVYLATRMLPSKVIRGEWRRIGAVVRGCRHFIAESLHLRRAGLRA